MPTDAVSIGTTVLADISGTLEGLLVNIAPGLIALAAVFWAVRLVMRKATGSADGFGIGDVDDYPMNDRYDDDGYAGTKGDPDVYVICADCGKSMKESGYNRHAALTGHDSGIDFKW